MEYVAKVCVECGDYYVPTNGRQLYCEKCREVRKRKTQAEYRDRNREKLRITSREWYKNNKERSYQIKKKWREKNRSHDNKLNVELYYKHHEAKKEAARFRAEARKIKTKINCDECGSKTKLQIHHKDKNYKNNNLNNLAVLCFKCHRDLHSKE